MLETHGTHPSTQAPMIDAIDEVTTFLATQPTPEQVLAFCASPAVEERISELLEKNRTSGLSEDEEREWQTYERAGHLVRMAKVNAVLNVKDDWGEDQRRRYEALREKLSEGALSDPEHAELLRMTEEIELLQAERVAALAELARRRGKRLIEVMQELGTAGPEE